MGEGSRRSSVRFMKPGSVMASRLKEFVIKEVMNKDEFVADRVGVSEGTGGEKAGFRKKRNGN